MERLGHHGLHHILGRSGNKISCSGVFASKLNLSLGLPSVTERPAREIAQNVCETGLHLRSIKSNTNGIAVGGYTLESLNTNAVDKADSSTNAGLVSTRCVINWNNLGTLEKDSGDHTDYGAGNFSSRIFSTLAGILAGSLLYLSVGFKVDAANQQKLHDSEDEVPTNPHVTPNSEHSSLVQLIKDTTCQLLRYLGDDNWAQSSPYFDRTHFIPADVLQMLELTETWTMLQRKLADAIADPTQPKKSTNTFIVAEPSVFTSGIAKWKKKPTLDKGEFKYAGQKFDAIQFTRTTKDGGADSFMVHILLSATFLVKVEHGTPTHLAEVKPEVNWDGIRWVALGKLGDILRTMRTPGQQALSEVEKDSLQTIFKIFGESNDPRAMKEELFINKRESIGWFMKAGVLDGGLVKISDIDALFQQLYPGLLYISYDQFERLVKLLAIQRNKHPYQYFRKLANSDLPDGYEVPSTPPPPSTSIWSGFVAGPRDTRPETSPSHLPPTQSPKFREPHSSCKRPATAPELAPHFATPYCDCPKCKSEYPPP